MQQPRAMDSKSSSDIFMSLLQPPSSPQRPLSSPSFVIQPNLSTATHDKHKLTDQIAKPDEKRVPYHARASREDDQSISDISKSPDLTDVAAKPGDESSRNTFEDQPASSDRNAKVEATEVELAMQKAAYIPIFNSRPAVSSPLLHPFSPPPAPLQSQLPITSQDGGKALDVADALTYLDLVKVQFEELPLVYNRFLDVMKDFKSSAIDTPGVIDRVSSLFQGHPRLIQGFNTFLPPGYRIECGEDPNIIYVTTPTGTTARSAGLGGTSQSADGKQQPAFPPNPDVLPEASVRVNHNVSAMGLSLGPPASSNPVQSQAQSLQIRSPSPLNPLSRQERQQTTTPITQLPRITPQDASGTQLNQLSPAPTAEDTASTAQQNNGAPSAASPPSNVPSPGVVNSASNAATVLGGMHRNPAENATVQHGPVNEFHHAMTYINRIKTRFADNQEVYKGFLQLLQSYQKEQMTIQEAYSQVAVLFKDATDLLDEFKLFLPDKSNSLPVGSGDMNAQSFHGGVGEVWSAGNAGDALVSGRKADATTQGQKRKRRPADKDAATTSRNANTKVSTFLIQCIVDAQITRLLQQRRKPATIQTAQKAGPASPTTSFQLTNTASPRMASVAQAQASTTHFNSGPSDESTATFFEQLKRSLEDPEAYNEFLKVLEMFSMDVFDANVLLERLEPFLSIEEMNQFLELLGWDVERSEEIPEQVGDSAARRRALASLEKPPHLERILHIGPSYRSCPVTEIGLACSGRDELCRTVLNDEWESHPTWASEESGFATHKKNSFEDALHRSEEERHEYQFHIEAMSRALSVLEPLRLKMESMPADERMSWRLPPNLGTSSPSIHQRIIKKVYGRDAGLEVIQALHEYPAVALPVVVDRLRLKDEEWRRFHRDWNKQWREVDTRNFYKSFDHQGVVFKANDKKAITTRALVTQIEVAREEAINHTRQTQQAHLEFSLADSDVLQDVIRLCLSSLEHQTLAYSSFERRATERFLRQFVPLLIGADFAPFDAVFGTPLPVLIDEEGNDEHITKAEAHRSRKAPEPSKAANGSADSSEWIGRTHEGKSFPKDRRQLKSPQESTAMFTNTTFYILIRLVQLVYSRLHLAKTISRSAAAGRTDAWIPNPVAVDLGVNDMTWSANAAVSSLTRGHLLTPSHFYDFLLGAVGKLIDGELDQSTFEDCTRVVFGNQAYMLFTLDKVIAGLNKQAQIIACDGKGGLEMIQEQRGNQQPSVRDQIRYRIQTQLSLATSDEYVYKIQLKIASRDVGISLLRREDPSVDLAEGMRQQVYIESYTMNDPTEGLAHAPNVPYLNRNLRTVVDRPGGEALVSYSGMAIGFRDRCKLAYAADKEDVHVRYQPGIKEEARASRARMDNYMRQAL